MLGLGVTLQNAAMGHATSGPAVQGAPFIIDDLAGNTQVAVPAGGSVTVSVDGRPEQTITDTANPRDIGFLHAPFIDAAPALGTPLGVDLGVVYYEGDGPITIVQDIVRNGVAIASDIRTGHGPQIYDYTPVAADLGETVQLRSVLTNGSNVVGVLTSIVTPADMPIAAAGATGWYDFSDTSTLLRGALTGGVGDEIGLVTDKSGAGNTLSQTNISNAPRPLDDQVNGNTMLHFVSAEHLRVPDVTVRAAFFLISDVLGDVVPEVAGIMGTGYDDTGATHQHVFVRANGATDYDISVDGAGVNSGTVHVDTGDTGSGTNIALTGLAPAEREGTRLWYVALDADMPAVDVLGALRSGFTSLRNNGTLFGEVVLFSTVLTTAQANAVANDIAPRWGLTWSDIT